MRYSQIYQLLRNRTQQFRQVGTVRNMATSSRVQLSTADAGIYHVPNIKKVSAERASQLLQENHDRNHCFFNPQGFHNHIAHHILSIFALGASPEEIQKAYDTNLGMQRSHGEQDDGIIQNMHDRTLFAKYLNDEKYYIDYLQFFQSEIDSKGIGKTMQEHIFAGDDVAIQMLDQLFAGFLHPIIHTGFGIEFHQNAIVAEGLAETATSDSWIGRYFDGIRQKISANASSTNDKSLFDLLKEISSNKKLAHSASWNDANKVRDGVLVRAREEMINIAAQWQVTNAQDLERKTAEMTNFVVYFTGAALNPRKQIKFDFYYMHSLNASIFFWSFLQQPWLTDEQKCRLLEMKGWIDLALYVSRNTPELYPDEITKYQEKQPGDWNSLFRRVNVYPDDGHTSKFLRALANGEQKCKPYEEKEDWPIKGPMWLKLGHMVIDSVEADGVRWARSVGFSEAWKDYADRTESNGAHM